MVEASEAVASVGRGMPEPGMVLDGKLKLVRKLGEGGMGAVFEATNERTGRRVAVKVMRPELAANSEAVGRFIQEAHACGRVKHANVVDIYDAGVDDGMPYLVMEFLEGESLADRLRRKPALPIADAVFVTEQALEGLAAAHEVGIVHRDLKPDNVFLARRPKGGGWVVKLVDFGISKMTTGALGLARTSLEHPLGTPLYMSPEQAQSLADVDARTDLYSLGVTLFEALTGVTPFERDTYNAVILAIMMAPLPSARERRPDVPPPLDAVLQRAMARDRGQRFQTASEFAEGLREAVAPKVPPTRLSHPLVDPFAATAVPPVAATLWAPPPATPVAPTATRAKVTWVFAAVLCVAAAVGLGARATSTRRRDGDTPPEVRPPVTILRPTPAIAPPAVAPSTAVIVVPREPDAGARAAVPAAPVRRRVTRAREVEAPAVVVPRLIGTPVGPRPASGGADEDRGIL
jgi:serine/threonine-protein kinase